MDQGYLLRRSSELTEIAEAAGLGHVSWIEFNRTLADIVPDSGAVFFSNHHNPDAPLIVEHGLGIEAMVKYKAHFEDLNPWNAFWAAAKTGKVYRSSEVMPARSFSHTEFYNDWLAPLGNRFDGIGIKLEASADVSLMLSMQLPDKRLADSETVLAPLLTNIGGALIRSVSVGMGAQGRMLSSMAAASLVNRSPDMAFAIDQYFNVVEANPEGEHGLTVGRIVKAAGRKLRLRPEPAHKWLQNAVRALSTRQPLAQHRLTFAHEQDVYQLSVFHVPEYGANRGLLLGYRYLVLVLIRKISGQAPQVDVEPLLKVYGLAPSEVRMCKALMENLTLAEVADRLQITRETARQRLKQIFHKTGVNRQADLITLMLRVS